MPERPALPKLKRGDHVIVRQRRSGNDERHIVTGAGPKYVRVVLPRYYGTPHETSHARRFLLADQSAGAPGSRYGCVDTFATLDQHAYDEETRRAREFLSDRGLVVRSGSPFADRDNMVNLANLLREMWPDA